MPSTVVNTNAPQPPNLQAAGLPDTSGEVGKFFDSLYDTVFRDGGSFNKLNIVAKDSTATFSTENMWFRSLTLNCGLYVNYASDNGNILYGFAAQVRRSAGSAFVVAAQLDAIGGKGCGAAVFGCAIEAIGEAGFTQAIIGQEISVGALDSTNLSRKWGTDYVFKDRADYQGTVPRGIGSNLYNYNSMAIVFDASGRSAAGEYCGWTRGLFFVDGLDQQTAPAWSATQLYLSGMIVTSGGRTWVAKQNNINQAPTVPSVYWQHNTPTGTGGLAIGIDFTCMSPTGAGRMASAIRLQDFMRLHWDVTGAIGTYFDSTGGLHVITENTGAVILGMNASTGEFNTFQAPAAPGAGAAATLATTGGAGPANAAQNGWLPFKINGFQFYWPVWT